MKKNEQKTPKFAQETQAVCKRAVELFSRLKEQGRMDDISRALSDRGYLEELLGERE